MHLPTGLPRPSDLSGPQANPGAFQKGSGRSGRSSLSSTVALSLFRRRLTLKLDIGREPESGGDPEGLVPGGAGGRARLSVEDHTGRDPMADAGSAHGARAPQANSQAFSREARACGDRTAKSRTRARDNPAVNFWRALSPAEQQAFTSVADERTFAGGATLMHEGEQANHVIVILGGWTRICVRENGRQRTIAERGPGQLVGERGAFQVNVRSATVIALETVQALVMKTEDFAAFVSAHPDVLDIVEGQVYERLTEGPGGCGERCRYALTARPTGPRPADRPGSGPLGECARRRLPPLSGQNCTVLRTDVVGFGARTRNDEDRLIIRQATLDMTQTALESLWDECSWEDRGDGLLMVVPPAVPTTKVMEHLLTGLPLALKRHNHIYADAVQIQLRVAVDVGPVVTDIMGVSGEAIIVTARLVDAPTLKAAIAKSGANLGVITSAFVYETVIRHGRDPAGYRQIQVDVKESRIPAWMQIL